VGDDEVGEKILGCALKVHRALGPGLLESAYEACLAYELTESGLQFDRQRTLPIIYNGVAIDAGYRLDLLVEGRVVLEVKAVDRLATSIGRNCSVTSDSAATASVICSTSMWGC
jgi:GxxExxY protein